MSLINIIICGFFCVTVKDEEEEEPLTVVKSENSDDENLGEQLEDDITIKKMERDLSKPVSTAEMMAWREQLMAQ